MNDRKGIEDGEIIAKIGRLEGRLMRGPHPWKEEKCMHCVKGSQLN